ncbi:MAG: response regulator [Verrucomicrobiota bacterium]|nr:response regulator [Verrucomicrobiota bacterium]
MSSEGSASVSLPGSGQTKDRAKSQSFGNLKHELRTPLNHIIGYCEMLIEQAQDDGLEVFIADLDRIHSAGERLLDVVNDLCDPSRKIDEGMMHHEVRTPLNQVIGYAEILQEQAKELGQDSFIPDLQKVHTAGRHLLDLILENFASTQVDPGPAESEVITFTRQQAAARESPTKDSEIVKAPVENASLLVVDDNELNRDMLTRRLERLGYKVSCAENGSEALKKIRAEPFDLLLLDIMMPVMDGFEVLEQLKAEPVLRDIPVIVLSASDQLDHAVKCIQKGATDYLTKPFNPVLLQARIGSCLERKRLHDKEISYLRQIQEEKKRSDELLHVILPREIAAELKDTAAVKPHRFEKVGILFCDVVGFTAYSERHRPEEILSHLQSLVEAFEQLCSQHSLEKIKTIGDSFMATAGLLAPLENPALDCVKCGLEMITVARSLPACWNVRVGVHVGPVIAGVVGRRKYQYDVWGDTVNTAARMQTAADPGAVCVNEETWNLIAEHCCGRRLGRIKVKGKGEQELFLVDSLSD